MSTLALSWRREPPAPLSYALAVLSVTAAILATLGVEHLWSAGPQSSFFICVIMFVAWACGTGPALLATGLAILAFDYFFLEPKYSLALQLKDLLPLVLLAVASFFAVSLSAAQNTERRRVERNARSAEQGLQAIIDTIPALVARRGSDGQIDFVNLPWRTFTGLSQDDPGGLEAVAFHPDDRVRMEQQWLTQLAKGEAFETEYRMRRADGEYRWLFVRREPLRDENGDVIAWYGVGYDIEDRKRAEDAQRRGEADLAEAARKLQLTIDTIPTLVARYKADSTPEFANQTLRDYLGADVAIENLFETVHPDDHSAADRMWRDHIATGESFEFVQRLRRADGEYRRHFIRRVPLHDDGGNVLAWYGAGYDIEDQRRAESALQRSQAYLAEGQKLSRTGTFAWEFDTKEYFWSEESYRIMGVDRTVKPSIELVVQRVHPDDRPILYHEMKLAAEGALSQNYKLRLLLPDGEIKHLHVVAHHVKYDSGREENVGAMMDITEAKKAEEALSIAHNTLAHASRVSTLGEVSASIAHEVNQPLAAIVANAQACLRLLSRESADLEKVRGAVERIVKDGNRAAQVVSRVRGLVKQADAERTKFDVNEIINEVIALLQRELATQRVLVRLDLAPALPLVVADRIQLQQVIINLLMNGIESLQAITSKPRTLLINSRSNDMSDIVVSLKDNGPGIAAGTIERLFDAFYSTKPSGLGIGLSICRSIIENHDGRLWATDNGGEPGATFQFVLPRTEAMKFTR